MEVALLDLWLPILISSIAVFFASSLAWMVLPHHRADVKVIPDEAAFTSQLSELNLPPGQYMWPNCNDRAEYTSQDYKDRFNSGPWGTMIIPNGQPNFLRNLGITFAAFFAVAVFTAYILSEARSAGAPYLSVFQIAGATSFAAYALGGLPHSAFFGRPARALLTDAADALAYTLISAGIFAAFWPPLPAAI